jgi:hypothetical protein
MRTAVPPDKLHLTMTEHQLFSLLRRYTEVTVLSAVGKLPPQHLVRSTGTAMSTTGSHGVRAAQRSPSQFACTLAPVGNSSSAPLQSRECIVTRPDQAPAGCADQRNGSPERQMLWRIVQSFLASATRALPIPERFAIAWAQSFNPA